MSAGSQPTGHLNSSAIALLAREGISTLGCYSKSWENLPLTPDIVVTVCSSAAGEICPAYLGQVVQSHWAVEDPGRTNGSEEDVEAAFMATYRILRVRIEAFLALALVASAGDHAQLQRELDRIGKLVP